MKIAILAVLFLSMTAATYGVCGQMCDSSWEKTASFIVIAVFCIGTYSVLNDD